MKIRNYFQREGNFYIGFLLGMANGYLVWQGSNNLKFGVAAGLSTWIIIPILLDIKDKL